MWGVSACSPGHNLHALVAVIVMGVREPILPAAIMEQKAWKRNNEGDIMQDQNWSRNHGGEIMDGKS